ncbi:hypothetical protein KZ870_24430 [Pseudomonas aeruginosa]|nr:hypothetical protein [Pseudomonas aeruginosa]
MGKKGKAFLDKVKGDSDLCKKDVTDENAKKVLDVNDATNAKGGAKVLGELNKVVNALVTASNGVQ